MARWINVTKAPFDYRWPDRSAITAFKENGDHFVKDEVADFAVANGYASEGKGNPKSRSSKGGKKRVRARNPRSRKAKEKAPAKAADMGAAAGLGNGDVPAADRPADRPGVDSDAG